MATFDPQVEPNTLNPDLGLGDANREGVVQVLNTVLADQYLLYTKLRKYHWNVTGPQFHSLHELFEQQYTQLEAIIDVTAERIRTYGAMSPGTLAEFQQLSRLEEQPSEVPNARHMIEDLISDHENVIRNLRTDIKKVGDEYDDAGSEDYLTQLLQDHQKMAWLLRSFIEGIAVYE
jgi:starvation-inducible DNA-binding protein